MKAVIMTGSGAAADVLKVQDIPGPQLDGDRDILVRLHAAGVNPIDTKIRKRGTFHPDLTPDILGCDGAGVVEAIASGVQTLNVGDEVYFCNGGLGGPHGNYAEYIAIDERFVAKKPSSLSFVEAAAAPLVLITAWEALYDRAGLQPGQKVLIQAGAGGVGHVAIQLAKLKGAEVATTVSTPEKAEFVRKLGADLVILYKEQNVIETVMDWTNGEGADIGFDTVGDKTFFETAEAVRLYGDVVTILEPNPEHGTLKTSRLRNHRISFELMLTPMLQNRIPEQEDQGKMLQQCASLFDEGKLMIHVGKTFPLEQAVAAHELLETGSMQGKIVLTMGS
ncbi:zinc-dependent alcohol dehydrogenase family protein [Laspinema sp. A4]|uniref:zinc-dependent alcohol dehydrogenase family protein n=1 Tax=Laspinema sp. D2d TaxID=2953686 RepID=UPI0021BB0124|nr:zinc-dependent alcohol dehydrogenase family protein [Laspinema sp. D2d]MCT7985079.1 zinc-dependent alcohol dehydrogenase family protein [Laspinema sp. D2d]